MFPFILITRNSEGFSQPEDLTSWTEGAYSYHRQDAPNQNSKSEYRNSKQTQRFKFQLRNPKRVCLEFGDFDHLDLFRISDFEFVILFILGALCAFARVTPTWLRLCRARTFVVKIFLPNHVWNNYSPPLLEKTLRSTAS